MQLFSKEDDRKEGGDQGIRMTSPKEKRKKKKNPPPRQSLTFKSVKCPFQTRLRKKPRKKCKDPDPRTRFKEGGSGTWCHFAVKG